MIDIKSTKQYFLKLVSAVINGTESPEINDKVDQKFLYQLASKNSSQVILYYALKDKQDKIDEQIFKIIEKSFKTALVREINQQSEIELIRKQFNEKNIDFMLLKGSHLKALYPAPEIRFMVDMDVLVKLDDVSRAEEIIRSHGLEQIMNNGKDIVFVKKPFLTIELHNSLFVEDYYMYKTFTDVWEKAETDSGCEYKMSLSDLYVYTMAHLAEHYTSAGSCFRPVIDIYLLNKKCKSELDFEYINSRFKELKLVEFANNIVELGLCWFEGKDLTDNIKTMENYIVIGAPVKDVKMASQATTQSKSRFALLISTAFPGMVHMKTLFPVLKKAPFLIPVFWIIRIFKYIFKKETLKTIDNIKSADEKDVEIMKTIFKKSGISM